MTAQELVTPNLSNDDQMHQQQPQQQVAHTTRVTQSAAYLSPLFINNGGSQSSYVNNAKILATYLIQIRQFDGSPDYQALHLIDQVIDYSFATRRKELKGGLGGGRTVTTTKRALSLDDIFGGVAENELHNFGERFGDLHQASPLHSARSLRSSEPGGGRVSLSAKELSLEGIGELSRKFEQLRGKLFNTNESTAVNTYFLPISHAHQLLAKSPNPELLLEAHILPERALFTRQLGLGKPEASLFERHSTANQRVHLSLAKSVATSGSTEHLEVALSSSPLLVQAHCTGQKSDQTQHDCRNGLTSAEIVLANIPLSNGVLHLIRQPLVLAEASLLDFVNDDDRRLSQLVDSVGSQTGNRTASVRRFRELLARERHVLAGMADSTAITLLVPTDEAFARLRYDLRALVERDEALIPSHWGPAYRAEKLEHLLRRHIIAHRTITSDLLEPRGAPIAETSGDSGKMISFRRSDNGQSAFVRAQGDAYEAQLVHRDLIGSNGVLHLVDRVLGEEQESVWSLLKSNVALANQTAESGLQLDLLSQRVDQSLRHRPTAPPEDATLTTADQQHPHQADRQSTVVNAEMAAVSQAIAQYLLDISPEHRQALANSANISYQLARLTGYQLPAASSSSAQIGLADDWNERLKQADRMFTYFVPSDLAWIKLQQSMPELYRPLAYFLFDSAASRSSPGDKEISPSSSSSSPLSQVASELSTNSDDNQESLRQRYAESSERLRQILERHLVINRKLGREELNKMDSVQTQGALLKLVELNGTPAQGHQHHQLTGVDSLKESNSEALLSHQNNNNNNLNVNQRPTKGLRFYSSEANITQVNEASNGYLYVIDNVLLVPEDSAYIVPASGSTSAIGSSVSSFLGARNTAILDFIHQVILPSNMMANFSAQSLLTTIASLTCAIVILMILAIALVIRRRRLSKLHNRHQQLESGLTSSNHSTGSTSTTKSL